ncbi:hypothetical protein RND71_030629 [Anisodus tanguticus]|uniref:Uncharacterized protein n=1 Tax=Anisodus tanguticus TaxID=243964 RepID=A0AAE1RGF2_9SOLA|nr:hypothetical protein RND71_030629 [Anisodus tanguticus]
MALTRARAANQVNNVAFGTSSGILPTRITNLASIEPNARVENGNEKKELPQAPLILQENRRNQRKLEREQSKKIRSMGDLNSSYSGGNGKDILHLFKALKISQSKQIRMIVEKLVVSVAVVKNGRCDCANNSLGSDARCNDKKNNCCDGPS